MLKVLTIDGEASGATRNKGHPFDPRNKLVSVGYLNSNGYCGGYFDYCDQPYGDMARDIQRAIDEADILVGCNVKYDIHWLRRYGIRIPAKIKIWDVTIAHFLLAAQRHEYPSLDDILSHYGLPLKHSKIKEYWKNGIDTDQIPEAELLPYMEYDIRGTYEVYKRQTDDIENSGLSKLMWLCCADLLVLEEMEWNGMKYNKELSLEKARELRVEEASILNDLNKITGLAFINWESPAQCSAILYGGTITVDRREPQGTFKSGKRIGQPRFRIVEERHELPRLVEPLSNTQLQKEGQFKTDEPTLSALPAEGKAKDIIERVLRLSRIQKLLGTYYEGLVKKFGKYGWEDNIIHHQLNQCVAVTGRLSSSNPNLQNSDKDPDVRRGFVSRYD